MTDSQVCDEVLLARAERDANGCLGRCDECGNGYSVEVSEGVILKPCVSDALEGLLVCLADPCEPLLVRRDEEHWSSECWEGA